jgi:hypothetical protein
MNEYVSLSGINATAEDYARWERERETRHDHKYRLQLVNGEIKGICRICGDEYDQDTIEGILDNPEW